MSSVLVYTKEDWIKILKGAGIAVGGGAVIVLGEYLQLIDGGMWAPLLASVASILINAGRKAVKTGKAAAKPEEENASQS